MNLKQEIEARITEQITEQITDQITGQITDHATGKTRSKDLLSVVLYGLSQIYTTVMTARAKAYKSGMLKSFSLPCLVISVGNLTTGGSGKTPLVIYMAELLRSAGLRTVILSRGYKGSKVKQGGIAADGSQILMTAAESGDEPHMMALRLKNIPVVVGADRVKSGMTAVRAFHPDVILLDDAFQHVRLKRDLNIVLADAAHPFGNGFLLPRGPLREPQTAINRADAVVLTRGNNLTAPERVRRVEMMQRLMTGHQPVFVSAHCPRIIKTVKSGDTASMTRENHKGLRVFAFSGIAKNEEFRHTIKLISYRIPCRVPYKVSFRIMGHTAFPDHHPYTDADLTSVFEAARHCNAHALITTEKDYARIKERGPWPLDLIVVGIDMGFDDQKPDFDRFILNSLQTTRRI